MNNTYVFAPRNPNLRHCSNTFLYALKIQVDKSTIVHDLTSLNLKVAWHLISQIFSSKPNGRLSIFFLAVQTDYLVLLCALKLISVVLTRDLKIHYLMHEPRVGGERTKNPIRSWIILLHQILFGLLSNAVILPSQEAVSKAETYVKKDKIYQINLTFLSIPTAILEKNLLRLKSHWDNKTFTMMGTVSSLDKNPQGFSEFATITNQLYPEKVNFIRAGRDRNIDVQYSQKIVRFPCYLSECSKQFLFDMSHFIIVPYFISTQSGVISEALSHGKILIVNDISAFQYLKGLDFVFMIDFSDKKSILTCIQDILNMSFSEYENYYWSAVKYFQLNHSEAYLSEKISSLP
jgi:hypothetical protein